MNIILAAAQLAARYHSGRTRKNNGRPYITHPIRVAGRVATLPGMEDADVAAAFLHDALEDVPKSLAAFHQMQFEILETCGQETLDIVTALTNPGKDTKLPRSERKKIDREHLAKCPRRVKRIKLVDRIDNLEESVLDLLLGHNLKISFNEIYADESEQLLIEALQGADADLEAELVRSIQKLRLVCSRIKLSQSIIKFRDALREKIISS